MVKKHGDGFNGHGGEERNPADSGSIFFPVTTLASLED